MPLIVQLQDFGPRPWFLLRRKPWHSFFTVTFGCTTTGIAEITTGFLSHLSVSGTNKALTSSSNHGFHLYCGAGHTFYYDGSHLQKNRLFAFLAKKHTAETWGNLGSLGFTTTEAMAPPTKQTFSRSSNKKHTGFKNIGAGPLSFKFTGHLYMAPADSAWHRCAMLLGAGLCGAGRAHAAAGAAACACPGRAVAGGVRWGGRGVCASGVGARPCRGPALQGFRRWASGCALLLRGRKASETESVRAACIDG